MSAYLEAPPGSRPTTTTDTDLDVFGTPAANTPLMAPQPLGSVPRPMPSALSLSAASTPRESGYNNYLDREQMSTPNNNSAPLLTEEGREATYGDSGYNKELAVGIRTGARRRPFYKRPWFYLLLLAAAVVIALAVALPVTLVGKKSSSSSGSTSSGTSTGGSNPGGNNGTSGTGGGGGGGSTLATSGGDGSTVTTDDGSTFIYHNSFGGFCESHSCALIEPVLNIKTRIRGV